MERIQAFLILGLGLGENSPNNDEIYELYEEAVFNQASFFMRRAFVPQLTNRRIDILKDLDEALRVLSIPTPSEETFSIPEEKLSEFGSENDLQDLQAKYNAFESTIKLRLANSRSSTLAIEAYEAWISIHDRYAHGFMRISNELGLERINDIPKTELIPTSDLFTELKSGKTDGLVRREYSRLSKIYLRA